MKDYKKYIIGDSEHELFVSVSEYDSPEDQKNHLEDIKAVLETEIIRLNTL